MARQMKDFPLMIIRGAMNGEREAITYILRRYDDYIKQLSTRVYHDEFGSTHYYVDEDKRTRLKSKLVYSIINDFKILPENE